MTEQELFAKIGRMQVQTEAQDAAYTQVLHLLAGVVGGTIEPGRVLVNLTDRSWNLAPEGFRQGMPAQINGLPVVVVAPEPKPPEPKPEAEKEHPRPEPAE